MARKKSPDQNTELFAAVRAGDKASPKVIELLLRSGADPNLLGGEGCAPLNAHGSPTAEETATRRMQAVWKRIGRWFKKNAPSYGVNLSKAKGASQSAIEKLERKLKVELPSDFRAYLALYGGSDQVGFYEYNGLPVEQIASRWAGLERLQKKGIWKKVDPRELSEEAEEVQWAWWHAGWIPFAEDGGGNLYCVDLRPGPRGRRGQVIQWEIHAGPVGPVAPSFDMFLDNYLAQMQAGKLLYSEECLFRK